VKGHEPPDAAELLTSQSNHIFPRWQNRLAETHMPSKKPHKILLFGGGFDNSNLGVGALTVGAIKCLLSQYPQSQISLLEYGCTSAVHSVRLGTATVQVPTLNMRFSWRLYLANNIAVLLVIAGLLKFIPSKRPRQWVTERNNCLQQIHEADLVASIAGGDSFCDIYGLERLLYVTLPQILALLLGVKLVLLPQTIGPFRGWLSTTIAKYIVRRAEHIFSRDRQGLRVLERLMGSERTVRHASFCYDVGFVMDPIRPVPLELEGIAAEGEKRVPLVGINLSGLLYMGGYTHKNMFGLRADYRQFSRRLIDLFIREKGATVLLVPHVLASKDSAESDLAVCERVYEELKPKYGDKLGLVRRLYDPAEMKYVIGKCDFFLGSRMHSCIGAVSQCVPAVSIAYSDKFVGVMETVGVQSAVADARLLTEDQMLDMARQVYDQRATVRRELEGKMVEVESAMASLFGSALCPSLEADTTDPAYQLPLA